MMSKILTFGVYDYFHLGHAEKAQYAKEQNLGGVMIYHLLCDKTDEDSLICAVSNAAFSTKETE